MPEIVFASEGKAEKINYGIDIIVPEIVLSLQAYLDIRTFIREVPGTNEISWFGFVETEKNEKSLIHYINEVFLVEQDVSGASTDMTTEGLSKVYHDLMQTPEGEEKAGKIKYWGHLHPWDSNGGTGISGSATDEAEFLRFGENGNDFFIRAIYSKNLRASYCYFDYANKMRYNNLSFSLRFPENSPERVESIAIEIKEKIKLPVVRTYSNNFDSGKFDQWNRHSGRRTETKHVDFSKYADLFEERFF